MKSSVCVIDDDEIYRKIIRKVIERAGVFSRTWFFSCAIDALKQMENDSSVSPDIILLDINMPAMDGWQFVEALKKDYPELCEKCSIYIVTSSIAYSDRKKIEENDSIVGYLTKPVNIDTLKKIAEDK